MKNARKLTSILVLIAMLFMIAAPAMAADPATDKTTETNGSVTVTNPKEGQTYTLYKLFDADTGANNAITYTLPNGKTADDLVYTDAKGGKHQWFKLNDNGFVEVYDSSVGVDWAKDPNAIAWAKSFGTLVSNPITASDPVQAGEVTWSELSYGYYFVDTTLGSFIGVNSANKDAQIQEKNEVPGIEKKVQEDSLEKTDSEGWQDNNDADINQVVNFKTTVSAKPGAQQYVVHDVMSAGLTLTPNSVKVKDVDSANYTVEYNPTCTHADLTTRELQKCAFTITFKQDYLDTIKENTDIVITYSATLNKDAVIAGDGNPNDTKLDYGDNNHTEWDTTITYTYKFDLVKTDETSKVLDGAEFNLYDAEKGGNLIPLVKEDGYYRVANETEKTAEGFESATITAGQALIKGLDGHTSYWLEETKAPEGYNKLTARKEVKIEDDNLEAKVETIENVLTWTEGGVQVVNKAGTLLPSTGGIGTTIFYVVGAALVVGAGVLLVTKKRMTGQR